jgi:hypothetical protein
VVASGLTAGAGSWNLDLALGQLKPGDRANVSLVQQAWTGAVSSCWGERGLFGAVE